MQNDVYPPLEEKLENGKGDAPDESKLEQEQDQSTVKFLPNGDQEGDVKIEVGHDEVAMGMGKEELMKYADDPFWVRIRWILLIIFGLAWLGMLAGAIAIVVTAPGCPAIPADNWFNEGVTYMVHPRSFQDSDGDGNGDLKGIESRLDYLNDLKVNALWILSPYAFGENDFGYHVMNHTSIAPMYGTMTEFGSLVTALHAKDIKIILDFIPNYTSNEHMWFVESRQGTAPYKDFYVWADGANTTTSGGGVQPPNNWLNRHGTSAWTWDAVRGQFYYHSGPKQQPELNLRDDAVKKELKDVLTFWLKKGVDGFVMRDTAFLIESEDIGSDESAQGKADYDSMDHALTKYQNGSYELVSEWKSVIEDFVTASGRRFLITDCGGDRQANLKFLNYGSDSVLNMGWVGRLDSSCDAECVRGHIKSSTDNSTGLATWQLGDDSHSRIASLRGSDYTNVLNMMTTLLPGGRILYYGEEIGLLNSAVPSFEETKDAYALSVGKTNYDSVTRDPYRGPMVWSSAAGGNFTSSDEPWLPLGDLDVNVEDQRKANTSSLAVYMRLGKLRGEPAFVEGEMTLIDGSGANLIAFRRRVVKKEDEEEDEEEDRPAAYLVVLNFGDAADRFTLPAFVRGDYPATGTVVVNTEKAATGASVSFEDALLVNPGQGFVIKI
ncbi:PREDICTED: maltase A3-like isoform X2 [Priapulus caudatus]|uniref:alpha-glucosidase n=1 Tax=Priapulus caudatus TaxID=37621 RepID=A0ABM1EVE7_PRICU|nr:PREDICTED: maltase A3-like isoform X2 [Priapulus caudatus]